MNKKIKRLVIASLLAALVCIVTMLIKIPSPLKGYINLGDCVVLISGWMLSPAYGFLAAGIGSALADVFSGYTTYAPVTFLVKGVMALIAFYGFKLFHKRLGNLPSRIISGVLAEIMMIVGYYIFEGFLYGFTASLVNIPPNGIQGVAGLTMGIILMKAFEKRKISFE